MTDAAPARPIWWVALLLSILAGAGWLYVGRPRIFCALFAAFALIYAVPYLGWSEVATPSGVLALAAALVVVLALIALGPVALCLTGRARLPGWRWPRLCYVLAGALFWGFSAAPALLGAAPATLVFVETAGSMEPTLRPGDRFVADGAAGRLAALGAGDVIVFYPPDDPAPYVKRIVAGPGDEVRLIDGAPEVNGRRLTQEPIGETGVTKMGQPATAALLREEAANGRRYEITRDAAMAPRWRTPPVVLGPDEFYVLGDHRENSRDSREPAPAGFGPVPREKVIGVVTGIYWSPDFGRIGLRLDD